MPWLLVSTFPFGAAPVGVPLSILVNLLPLLLLLSVFYPLAGLARRQRYADAPIAGLRAGESIKQARRRFTTDAKAILQEAYAKNKGRPFYVPTPEGEKLMLPPEYVDELKNLPDEQADAAEPFFQAFESKYTNLGSRELLHRRCVRNHLYQNIDDLKGALLDEVRTSIRDEIGPCEEWTDVPIADCIIQIIARVSSRAFGGTELSRNKAWINAAVGAADDGALGALKLKAWPTPLKPLIARFIPEIRRIGQHYQTSRSILVPILERREALPDSEKANDFLQWMTDDAQGAEKDKAFLADLQLNIAFTAMFTSSAAVIQLLYDLCAMPEYMDPLREEIRSVQQQHPHLDKVAVAKLQKLDSIMKESQRFNPLLLVTFTRWIWKPIQVLDLLIPAHTNVGVPAQAMTMDPDTYPNPQRFDGFRFSDLRARPDLEPSVAASYQWATASLENMAFGVGRVGCPGRQFASFEIKMVIMEILMTYDLRSFPSRQRPHSFTHEAQVLPDRGVRISMRRRREALYHRDAVPADCGHVGLCLCLMPPRHAAACGLMQQGGLCRSHRQEEGGGIGRGIRHVTPPFSLSPSQPVWHGGLAGWRMSGAACRVAANAPTRSLEAAWIMGSSLAVLAIEASAWAAFALAMAQQGARARAKSSASKATAQVHPSRTSCFHQEIERVWATALQPPGPCLENPIRIRASRNRHTPTLVGMALKPLTLWLIGNGPAKGSNKANHAQAPGPNSWKVAIILKELNLPFEVKEIGYGDVKQKPYIDINPNGRVPALHDPNTNVTLWESCAINEYLVDRYDTEHKLTHTTLPEKYLEKQYLYFQASGQGPYFGQAAWFFSFHPESVPSAKERYAVETRRVISVLDGILSGRKYLVGEKLTYADLAFVMWDNFVDWCVEPGTWDISAYPNFKRWHEEMLARDSVQEVLEDRAARMAVASGQH